MKILLLSMLLIPSIVFGELVCPLIDGCPIKNGVCIGCIEKEETIQIVALDKLKIKLNEIVKPDKPKLSKRKENRKCFWKCVIAPCDDDMLPNGCEWIE